MSADALRNSLEAARVELLDLGLRNKMVSWRPSRRYGVEIEGEDPAAIFDKLVRGTASFGFKPKTGDDAPEASAPASRRRNRLMTGVGANEMQSRLLRTSAQARTLLEEQGVNTLFLALGMIEWYESESSETPRHAPLLLIPVRLARESIRSGFTMSWTGEDLGPNASFAAKSRADFGLNFPVIDENEIDDVEIEVDAYFDAVERAIADFPRWKAQRDMAVVDFFSFSKLLMHADLDPENWLEENDAAAESGVLDSLLGEDGFSDNGASMHDGERLDDHLRPEDVHHVIDADSSQALAILEVERGRNLVIQGPPGTGKSQTITNVIADAVADGKTVLFVAEKMAALEVVKRKLDEIHLGVACLELHSHKSTKRLVLDELQRTLQLGEPSLDGIEDDFAALGRARDALNRHSDAVNEPVGDTGVSLFDAYGKLMAMRERLGDDFQSKLKMLEIAGLDWWPSLEYSERRQLAENLQSALGRTGALDKHVFGESRLGVALPQDIARISEAGAMGIDVAATIRRESQRIANALGIGEDAEALEDTRRLLASGSAVLEAPTLIGVNVSAAEWTERAGLVSDVVDAGARWANLRADFPQVVNWNLDVAELRTARAALAAAPRGFLSFTAGLRGAVRDGRALLSEVMGGTAPKDVDAQVAILDIMIAEREEWSFLNDLKTITDAILSDGWRGERTPWLALRAACEWMLWARRSIGEGEIHPNVIWAVSTDASANGAFLGDLRDAAKSLQAALSERLPEVAGDLQATLNLPQSPIEPAGTRLDDLDVFFTACRDHANDIGDVARVNLSLDAVSEAGMGVLAHLAREWDAASTLMVDTLDVSRYNAIVARAMMENPEVAGFDGAAHDEMVNRFGQMDALALEHNCARVAHAHYKRLPSGQGGGQVRILRREFEKKRRHKPIRTLMTEAGRAIQAIKPVFMMSPMSVAAYLPPGRIGFNLVVFDEASQVKPVDALGSLARAKQAVVVGDDKQLPPTSFFDTATRATDDDDDDNVTGDLESVLGLMRAQGCPTRMLRWHYRSRHESLIALSNREFYEDGLMVFPSPDSERMVSGLRFHHLPDAVYERGTSRRNPIEAEAVAEFVMRHARETPHLTLGVATFSTAQREAVMDQLELKRREDDSCEAFFAAHPEEPFFVKNLENVQGDERDVIFISVGYGRDQNGRVTMNFGPLNRDGGERRLNVIITRARIRCHVFSNLTADDISASASARGIQCLRSFLAYAQTGDLSGLPAPQSNFEVDSPFQRAVESKLQGLGYEIHSEVGVKGFFIDIAVVDPERRGRYLIGIECDGATYHSSLAARDRDRIRASVLRGLGWKLHRIWSTDWFANPDRELRRAVEAIEKARAESTAPRDEEATQDIPATKHTRQAIDRAERDENGEEEGGGIVPYQLAKLPKVRGVYHASDMSRYDLAELVVELARVESPVHIDEVTRRAREAYGFGRAGRRIRDAVNDAIGYAASRKRVRKRGDFLWDPAMSTPPIRDRSAHSSMRKIELVCDEEIAEAVKLVVRHGYGIHRDGAPAETAQALGFGRLTQGVRTRIASVVGALIERGDLVERDGEVMTA